MADEGLLISIVPLVIPIAFVVAVAQALHQYAASAEGYKKCQKSVMGNWAEGTRRVFVWSEFRVNTVFETWVVFLSTPDNTRGPIAGRPVYNIDGTLESYRVTRAMSLAQQRGEFEAAARDAMFRKSIRRTMSVLPGSRFSRPYKKPRRRAKNGTVSVWSLLKEHCPLSQHILFASKCKVADVTGTSCLKQCSDSTPRQLSAI